MSLSLTPKKAIVAVAALAPLFVAGCSSADEETAAKNTSTVTSTSETAAETPTEDPEHDAEKDGEDKDKAAHPDGEHKPKDHAATGGPNGGPAPQGNHDGQPVNPFGNDANAQRMNVAPVEGGQNADEQTANEIRQLVDGQYQQNNLADFISYIPNNTCAAVLNEIGGAEAFNVDAWDPQSRALMQQAYEMVPNQSGIESVTNIQRNGDRASATVRTNTPQGIDEGVQRYQLEDGKWKFCK